jgi:(p)ppGpp synthase/HD superfamily hydrolase
MATFRKKLVRAVSKLRLPRIRHDDLPGRSSKKGKSPKKNALPPPAEIVQPDDPIQVMLRAASFAARKHRGQTRADGATPYFSHVARVTIILSHVFGVTDHATLTAAFLHDSLEDTDTDYDELEEAFGKTIAAYVVALTKNVMLPKKKREAEYEKRLLAAPEYVKIAKMADIYDNLSDRVNSPKIVKTTQTAERLLAAFGSLLETPIGRTAHAITLDLLASIEGNARK